MEMERILFSGIGECRLAMATSAYHRYGELSQTIPHVCFIYGTVGNHWVGRWVSIHLNFFDVLFYKNTTKILSSYDIEKHRELLDSDCLAVMLWKHKDDSVRNIEEMMYVNERLIGNFNPNMNYVMEIATSVV